MSYTNEIAKTFLYGFIEKGAKCVNLIEEDLIPSITIKSIKLWFGYLKNSNIKSFLGIKIKFINYATNEIKETEYQGAEIEGLEYEVKELEIAEGDYLSKMNIGFDEYITHIKFMTKKGYFIECGILDEFLEKKTLDNLNDYNNIILNIQVCRSDLGIRAIRCNYMDFKVFCKACGFGIDKPNIFENEDI